MSHIDNFQPKISDDVNYSYHHVGEGVDFWFNPKFFDKFLCKARKFEDAVKESISSIEKAMQIPNDISKVQLKKLRQKQEGLSDDK